MHPKTLATGFLPTLIALVTAAWASPSPPVLNNLDFEQGEVGLPPPGWWGKSISTSTDQPQAGAKSLQLRNDGPDAATFGRSVVAAPYRGQWIRFRGAVRSSSTGGAGLWLRIDGAQGKMLFLDNMTDRLVRSSAWTWADITVRVPSDAERINLGGLLLGTGTAGFDSASFEIVPESTAAITPDARAYLEHALDLLQARHINRDRVDWPTVRATALATAAHAQTTADTYPALRMAIAELGEKHTLLIPPGTDMQALAAGPNPPPLEIKTLGKRVVELKLPGVGGEAERRAAYTRTLSEAITGHMRSGACGWIVDLREDTGGDGQAMVSGLAALLGPSPWAGFRGADGAVLVWTSVNGAFAAVPASDLPKRFMLRRPALQPAAVLLGPRTTSAGEMTALAFAGRANTRSFGAPTAGYTTANSPVVLSDGALLALSDARMIDRTGKLIDGPIQPDEPTAEDKTEAAALAWLASKKCR
jgi:hypothetical protein